MRISWKLVASIGLVLLVVAVLGFPVGTAGACGSSIVPEGGECLSWQTSIVGVGTSLVAWAIASVIAVAVVLLVRSMRRAY